MAVRTSPGGGAAGTRSPTGSRPVTGRRRERSISPWLTVVDPDAVTAEAARALSESSGSAPLPDGLRVLERSL